MGLLQSVGNVFRKGFDKRKEEREIMEKIHKEAEFERLKVFEENLRKDALEVAKAKAKKDAAQKSGLQKLRQVNRLRNLNTSEPEPGSFFEKLRNYTQKNISKREDNLKKTEEMRKVALQMKQERENKMGIRNQNIRKPFGQSTWRP